MVDFEAQEPPRGIFAGIIEHKAEGPMVIEATGSMLSHDGCGERLEAIRKSNLILRTCVARARYLDGNELLFLNAGGAIAAKGDHPERPEQPEIFGFLVERKNEGPMIWEATYTNVGNDAANANYRRALTSPLTIRACLVSLTFWSGNFQLFKDLEGISK